MKTLVIHPEDESTNMLELVYKDKNYDVIRNNDICDFKLRKAIEEHERIILLGHGLAGGLINPNVKQTMDLSKLCLIDDSYADLLKKKETISIWCFSNKYFERHRMKGFHTGMIISEVDEARYVLGRSPLSKEELNKNMIRFSKILGECIEMAPQAMKDYVLTHYQGDDPITYFNRHNILVLE